MIAELDRRTAAAALLRDRGMLRMPMRGRSMHPTLREGMVLQLGPAAKARVGDVLVFSLGDVRVAHRVIGASGDAYLTAGDAQPHVVERVEPQQVIGRVVAVWSDASAVRRADGAVQRARGWYFAHFHPIRRNAVPLAARWRDRTRRALPHRRERAMPHLVAALAAAHGGDAARLARVLRESPDAFDDAAKRHRCAALLGEGARRLGILDRVPPSLTASMRRSRLDALLSTSRLHHAVRATVAVLREIGVPFALLKGAARSYDAVPEAAYHVSDDVDVLVQRADRDRVAAAMLARGYTCAHGERGAAAYRHHHHAPPLYPPSGKFPVEVHDRLAPPCAVSTATDWAALAPYLTPSNAADGPPYRLDTTGTALHLAIHAIGLGRLRDAALLARALAELDDDARDALRAIVRAERYDPVRLEASFVLAARIAGIAWVAAPRVERYVRWALLREDLPALLRARSDAIDRHFAHPDAPLAFLGGLVPWWSRGLGIALVPARFVTLCAATAAALAYAALMPRDDRLS